MADPATTRGAPRELRLQQHSTVQLDYYLAVLFHGMWSTQRLYLRQGPTGQG